ncbi:MAG: sigma-E processing peptidase SpoIIGA [Defluviitaleaceae bacterium]|nr:sigma-E processing peptidase SpoIIGA [Defluviitaleaceae bacterium]
MEIYADIVLLINFMMNSFILWAVAKLSRQKLHYLRLLAGGLAMALMYVLTIMMLPYSWWLSIVSSIVMLSVGIAVALQPKNVRVFLVQLFLGYICSFVLGGLGMMLFYRLATVNVSWVLLIICIISAYILIKLSIRLIEGITIKKQMLCPVTIYIGEDTQSLQALVDTGHTLHDPLNNAPVIIAEFESIKSLLPDGVRLLFYEQQENDLPGLLSVAAGSRFCERIRMIPFVSLGLSNGMLVGFRPDRVALSTAQKELLREDVVIGIYNRKLSGSGQYQGLISPELVA